MQVCVPATPVQMYYLLRRQMVRPYRKPLIIIYAEEPAAAQGIGVAARGIRERQVPGRSTRTGIDSIDPRRSSASSSAAARCITICARRARERGINDIAARAHRAALSVPARRVQGADREATRTRPRSCGARKSRATRARGIASSTICCGTCCRTRSCIYAGRDSSASPAAGYKSLHDEQQKELVDGSR